MFARLTEELLSLAGGCKRSLVRAGGCAYPPSRLMSPGLRGVSIAGRGGRAVEGARLESV
jgi:hypothetical protein